MNNWEIDEDLLYEERRMKELDKIEAYFLHFYNIPEAFRAWTNYKMGDKYVIELSNNDKKCAMKLEIDRDFYRKVDDIVRCHDTETMTYEEIRHKLGIN